MSSVTDKPRHRIWTFAVLAWVALVALPTTIVAVRWQLGIDRDVDMSGVHELITFFMLVSSLPAAIVAFGLLAPLAIAVDRAIRGRTPRAVNFVVGGVLGVPGFLLFLSGSAILELMGGNLEGPISANVWRVFQNPRTAAIVLMFVVGGMLVGLGLRHHSATDPSPQP
jgi:hypothetical protein